MIPLMDRFSVDKFWVKYIVLVVGGLLSAAAGIDFFADIIPIPYVGLVVSALFVGGGSEFVHAAIEALRRTNRGGDWTS